MTKKADGYGPALALGLIGGGLLLAASSAKQERDLRRETFRFHLDKALSKQGIQLKSATLGRGAENVPVWLVTVLRPAGLQTLRFPLSSKEDPYEPSWVPSLVNAFFRSA